MFSYISIDIKINIITTSGISWNEFYCGIIEKPKGILIVKGLPLEAEFCKKLSFEYISPAQIPAFSQSNVYDFGDFQWIDFEDVSNLANVSDTELAEILFTFHKGKPLKSYKIDSLQNHYVYISHDDDWFVKIHMDHLEKYKQVINYKICKELKGRKQDIHPIQENVMEQLFSMFQKGAVIDFEKKTASSVTIYQLEEINSMDDIYDLLDERRKHETGFELRYYSDKKQWSVV